MPCVFTSGGEHPGCYLAPEKSELVQLVSVMSTSPPTVLRVAKASGGFGLSVVSAGLFAFEGVSSRVVPLRVRGLGPLECYCATDRSDPIFAREQRGMPGAK